MSYRQLEQGENTMRGAVPKFSNARWRTCCLRFATVKLLLCLPKSENLELTWNGLDLGEATVGENVATTLLTPLAEGEEAETSFSPTLMVVLTALACEYAGRIPVSPLQLLRGLSRMLLSYSGACVRRMACFRACPSINLYYSIDTGSYPSDDDALGSRMPKGSPRTNLRRPTSQEHIRSPYITSSSSSTLPWHWPLIRRNHQRCSQFEDMIGKPDELRMAVTNSRSRSVRTILSRQMFIVLMHGIISYQLPDFLLALESKPPVLPRSPRLNSSSRTPSRSSLSGTQKLRYAAYDPPPPAQSRHLRAVSGMRSTDSLDSYDDLSRTVTAGDLAIAAGSPVLRALSPVRDLHFFSV
jgi:AP-4 complex subunit epsilon-1